MQVVKRPLRGGALWVTAGKILIKFLRGVYRKAHSVAAALKTAGRADSREQAYSGILRRSKVIEIAR